jgi:hypothetical protein
MDNLDRVFRHLVDTIRARFPQYLDRPFEVRALHQDILPYRHHRRELGLETNEDYEIAMLHLLAGAGGYLIVDDRMRDRLARELAAPNPDPAVYREFADAQVALSPQALGRATGGRASGPTAAAEAPGPATAMRPQSSTATTGAGSASRCPYCSGDLPTSRQITFCPHCGENLTVRHCAGCGAELDPAWKFCVTCGRPAAGASR